MGVTTKDTEAFLSTFFGDGNNYWPGRESPKTAERLRHFVESLTTDSSEAPYVLPRLGPGPEDRLFYVIPRLAVHSTRVREWVDAFVVPSYAPYSGRALDPFDPIDAAVIELVGHRGVLLLDVHAETSAGLWAALERLIETIELKPTGAGIAPLPLSRLLADFDLALAAGESAASAALLERLIGNGLSGSNYTNLVIKRLARLGNYGEIIRLPGLKSVAFSNPPGPVKDAILTAVYYRLLEAPLDAGDIETAKKELLDGGELVPPLAATPYDGFGPEALSVLAIAAAVSQDGELVDELLRVPGVFERIAELLPSGIKTATSKVDNEPAVVQSEDPSAQLTVLAPAVEMVVAEPQPLSQEPEPAPTAEPEFDPEPQFARPESWQGLFSAVGAGANVRDLLANEEWADWPPPATADQAIADVIAEYDDASAARAWSLAGAFIDADDFGTPAPKAAQALIDIALLQNRFGPADLAGLVTLTEIVLRSAPAEDAYTRLVDDLNADVTRWASVERSQVELDLADMLARNASPDTESRLRLTTRMLEPLSRQRARLSLDEVEMARRIDHELNLGLAWDQPEEMESPQALFEGNLLIYSLNESILARVEGALAELVPGLTVRASHDRAGSSQLRDWARRADYIALAIRCAKHAATGFIRQHAGERAVITEANGSGTASLLRAAMDAVKSGPRG